MARRAPPSNPNPNPNPIPLHDHNHNPNPNPNANPNPNPNPNQACAAFADGHPLIVGTIIADGWLPQLSQREVCAWLCLFIKDTRLQEIDCKEQPLPKASPQLEEVFKATWELADILEVCAPRGHRVGTAWAPRGHRVGTAYL